MSNTAHKNGNTRITVLKSISYLIKIRWRIAELIIAIMLISQSKEFITYHAEGAMEDIRINIFTPAPPNWLSHVRVVLINKETLERLKRRSPVDRAFLAQLLDSVLASGPKAVGLDLTLDQHGIDPEGERALIEVLAAARVPVVIAAPDPQTGLEADKRDAKLFIEQSNNTQLSLAPPMLHIGLGGIIRSFDLVRDRQKTFVAALAEATGTRATGERHQDIAWRGVPDPTQGQIPAFDAESLLENRAVGQKALEGKVVLIGLEDSGHGLMVRTPFIGDKPGQSKLDMPEVYVAAHIVDQLIEGRTAPHLGLWGTFLLCATMAGIGAALAWINNKIKNNNEYIISIALFSVTVLYTLINGIVFMTCGSQGGPGIALPILGPILFLHDAFKTLEK